MTILILVALLGVGVAEGYSRFREDFTDLAAVADSGKSEGFWSILTLVYAVVLEALNMAD